MKRREFIKVSLGAIAGASLASRVGRGAVEVTAGGGRAAGAAGGAGCGGGSCWTSTGGSS